MERFFFKCWRRMDILEGVEKKATDRNGTQLRCQRKDNELRACR